MFASLDTETTTDGFRDEEPIPRLVSSAIEWEGGSRVLLVAHDPTAPEVLRQLLRTNQLFMFNAPFDVNVILRAYPQLAPDVTFAYANWRIWDVKTQESMICHALGEHVQAYNLAAVVLKYLGVEMAKNDTWRMHFAAFLGLELSSWPADAVTYARNDAKYTLAAALEQHRRYRQFLTPAPEIAKKHFALYAQTCRGLITDQAAVDVLDSSWRSELSASQGLIIANGLGRWEGKGAKRAFKCKDKKARQLMLDTLGMDCPTTDTGLGAINDEAAAMLPLDHILRDYIGFKGLRNQWKKTIPIFRRPVVRTKYEECANTARTTSSGPQGKTKLEDVPLGHWVGTNLQNLQQKGGIRECLQARPGHVFVSSDWGGAELVANAQNQLDAYGSSPLADALIAGKNPHDMFTAVVFGCAYDKENPEHKAFRSRPAKVWNHGRFGGMGDATFQGNLARGGIEMDLPTIGKHNETWKALWDADAYFKWIRTHPKRDKVLKDGRVMQVYDMTHKRSGYTKGGCSYTEACNFPFQHLAAMFAGTALWNLWLESQDPASPLYKGEEFLTSQVLFVHDENVSEVPEDRAEAARDLQERIMIDAVRQWCPDVPIAVESSIEERYTK